MTKAEFNKILRDSHKQAMVDLGKALVVDPADSNLTVQRLISNIIALSVEASEKSVLQALEAAGFISFDG